MTGLTVEVEIHEAMPRLTAAEKRAARGLLANYPALGLGPVADFSRQCGASPATVLRFVSQLGFASYPDFQRRLRSELEERLKSPLQRPHDPQPDSDSKRFLSTFAAQAAANIQETAARANGAEFEAICQAVAAAPGACFVIGGRFTDAIAHYLAAHLRIIRPGVRIFDPRAASRRDQLLDAKAGDVALIFDVRRYDPELTQTARALAKRRVNVILITDAWISPAARHARHVLACEIETGRTWDSNVAQLMLAEAIVARVTALSWDRASFRMRAVEADEG
jgi:DNA-binding MurR/RpiR family transcriptional regulator